MHSVPQFIILYTEITRKERPRQAEFGIERNKREPERELEMTSR
jgi:hypothetical protein